MYNIACLLCLYPKSIAVEITQPIAQPHYTHVASQGYYKLCIFRMLSKSRTMASLLGFLGGIKVMNKTAATIEKINMFVAIVATSH